MAKFLFVFETIFFQPLFDSLYNGANQPENIPNENL